MFFGLTQEIATVIESIVVYLTVVEQQLYLLEYQIQVCHGMFFFLFFFFSRRPHNKQKKIVRKPRYS